MWPFSSNIWLDQHHSPYLGLSKVTLLQLNLLELRQEPKGSFKIESVHIFVIVSVLLSIWVFLGTGSLVFFYFSMVLEIPMKLCIAEPDILEKLFPQNGGNEPKIEFFGFKEKFVH